MFTTILPLSSLRASVTGVVSSVPYIRPALRSNLLSLIKCKEIFRTFTETTGVRRSAMRLPRRSSLSKSINDEVYSDFKNDAPRSHCEAQRSYGEAVMELIAHEC
jgi:hypothetical protein